uniref:Uncharacterized protein n=1 Tax=Lactuca sativa TaxID=4236 RepID=A0A9R1WB63_LACSA|nr:hypothetical protein LSAT_V11C200082920 [Lactuca sativa]
MVLIIINFDSKVAIAKVPLSYISVEQLLINGRRALLQASHSTTLQGEWKFQIKPPIRYAFFILIFILYVCLIIFGLNLCRIVGFFTTRMVAEKLPPMPVEFLYFLHTIFFLIKLCLPDATFNERFKIFVIWN